MASGATAGVKRARSEVHVYNAHMVTKRMRAAAALPCDLGALVTSDGALAGRVEMRARTLEALGVDACSLGALSAIVGGTGSLLALVDLNAHAPGVASVLADFAARGASVVDLNIRSHAYCMGDKHSIARAFAAAHPEVPLACDVLHFAVTHLFAQDCAVSVRVMSGGGVRDVLFADWCRKYHFCTGVGMAAGSTPPTPNVAIVTGEGGRIFLIPFAA